MNTGAKSSDTVESETATADRFIALIEVLIFLSLIVPSMVVDLFLFRQQRAGFDVVAWATIARDLALVALIFFFLWRNGDPIRSIGWTFNNAWKEVALGVVLFIPFFFGSNLLGRVFEAMGLSGPHKPAPTFLDANGTAQLILASFLVAVVAVSEETMFRGYLLLRFGSIMKNCASAVVISSFIFAMGHGYEGSAGMATVGVMGAVFALVYLWRKSLVAPITMHFLQDFIGIVLVPLLTRH